MNSHYTRQSGFALPTILIASVVMIIVMLAAVQAGVSVRVASDNQYYDRLAREAAQSGVVMARACIAKGSTSWTNGTPLRPNTNCGGGGPCNNDKTCFVLFTPSVRTSFSVAPAELLSTGNYKLTVTSTVERLRASNGSVWSTYTNSAAYITPGTIGTTAISSVAGGQENVCAIAGSGGVYCLGPNSDQQLGTGDPTTFFTPTLKQLGGSLSGIAATQVSIWGIHGCALAQGKAHCWGRDLDGALGNGAGGNQGVPGPVDDTGVLSGKTLTKITAGGTPNNVVDIYAYTCALDSTGLAYCWGSNQAKAGVLDGGMLGDGTIIPRQSPVAVSGGFQYTDIVAGKWHTCAIRTNGKLYCWGSDNNGQVGNGTGASVTSPVAVQGPLLNLEFGNANFTKIASGYAHTCAINSVNNGMWCWGQNAQGQLGDGTTTGRENAVKVSATDSTGASIPGWSQVTAGQYYTCGMSTAGKLYCWGGTGIVGFLDGQIGDGSSSGANRILPTPVVMSGVLNGKTITNIWNTHTSSFVKDSTGRYYSWGSNNQAQLGTGVRNTPAQAYAPIDATHFNNFQATFAPGNYVY
jgi:alpha-tubulin suppressor-like RCC1 family protein